MKLSNMVKCIEPSLTRQLFNKAKKYEDVIDLTLGDPDIMPLEEIKKAACQAILDGKTRYSANAGLIELREAISQSVEREYEIHEVSSDNVIVTVGGMEALFLTLACVIDDGDEVIVPGPYYVNYVQMIKMCGGIPVVVNTSEKNGFEIVAEDIENNITERTVAIILNTPCNPTGEVLTSDVLDEIAEIAKAKDLLVITDEVYRTLIYDGKKHESILTRQKMTERTILIDSVSKRFSMTGYRLGFAVGPQWIVEAMTKMQENVVACASLPSQFAALKAYGDNFAGTEITAEFEERRNYMYDAINSLPKLHCRKPSGTFYLFVNISETKLSSVDFANKLLEAVHVAVVPGIAYGKEYDNYVRIAFTLGKEKLKEAVVRIKKFVSEDME